MNVKYRLVLVTLLFPLPLAALANGMQKRTYRVAVDAEYAPTSSAMWTARSRGCYPTCCGLSENPPA